MLWMDRIDTLASAGYDGSLQMRVRKPMTRITIKIYASINTHTVVIMINTQYTKIVEGKNVYFSIFKEKS